MTDKVTVFIRLPFFTKEDEGMIVASCKILDVHSPGYSQQEAKKNLEEEIEILIKTSYKMGTLDKVLEECGFASEEIENEEEIISIDSFSHEETIEVPLPAAFIIGGSHGSVGQHKR